MSSVCFFRALSLGHWVHDSNFLNLGIPKVIDCLSLIFSKNKTKAKNFLAFKVWTWQCSQFKADPLTKTNMHNRNPLVTWWHELSLNWLKLTSQMFCFFGTNSCPKHEVLYTLPVNGTSFWQRSYIFGSNSQWHLIFFSGRLGWRL